MQITATSQLDLAKYLRPGDRLVLGHACGEPTTLIEALIAQARDIAGLSIFIATSFSGQFTVDAADRFAISSYGAIGALRTLAETHRISIIPCHASQLSELIESGIIGCDVAMVQISPANDSGEYSFGLVCDHMQAAIAKARVVIAEINAQVPFTYGDSLRESQINCAIHVSRAPVEMASKKSGKTHEVIARIAAGFVADGAVLQTGVGALPDAILRQLLGHRDLGVHSGMLGEGFLELAQAGVITNARKTIDTGLSVTCSLIGTNRLYAYAHRNIGLRVRSATYTHNSAVLARIEGLVTINSAVEVDLTGQVNAEQNGIFYIGGTGGQVDFGRAGSCSPGGHSIIALPATAKGGTVSRITACLSGPATTARSDADIIVTEFGAAELKGQTLAERARRLVAIAHPHFQEGLDRTAHLIRKRGF